MKESIITGRWSESQWDEFISRASLIGNMGQRVEFISRQFLGTDYRESTLTGGTDMEEVFVINLGGVDCFTFLDYVEAMRISSSFGNFRSNLVRVRYRNGRISFLNRNHFLTYWVEYNADHIGDVTAGIGRLKAQKTVKMLNLKEDGSSFLPGIEARRRQICFIPSSAIDGSVIGRLQSGDYAGIYSRLDGLDVSHAGIIIKTGEKAYLRHASSREGVRKVLDEDLAGYIRDKPGLVVLRPKA